jgi:presenilin-like A22 family membrane protease
MKKRNEIISALMPLVITLSLYLVFYNKIACKPNHAGFWFILALGASVGVVIARFSQRAFTKKD